MTSKRNNKGFSLVELLVAIGIVALLATIGTIAVTSFARKAKEQKTRGTMDMLMAAVSAYQESTGVYPNPNTDAWNACKNSGTANIYNVLKEDPSAFEKVKQMPADSFIMSSGQAAGFKDAWESPIYYNARGGMGGTPALWSAGADAEGTSGPASSTSTTKKDDIYSYHRKQFLVSDTNPVARVSNEKLRHT